MSNLTKLSNEEVLKLMAQSHFCTDAEAAIAPWQEIRRRLEAAENPPQESECAARRSGGIDEEHISKIADAVMAARRGE